MIKLAFYKAKGTWYNRLIRWWTGSPYSHVELVHANEASGAWELVSSSSRDGGVRFKAIGYFWFNYSNWTLIELDKKLTRQQLMAFYKKRKTKKYDFLGIALSQVLPLKRHDKNKYFCSEFCAEFLGLNEPHTFSPADLYAHVTKLKSNTTVTTNTTSPKAED